MRDSFNWILIYFNYCSLSDNWKIMKSRGKCWVLALLDNSLCLSGDETSGAWKESPECQTFLKESGLKNVGELKKYFARLMSQIADKEGLNLAAWGDGLKEGLTPYNRSEFPTNRWVQNGVIPSNNKKKTLSYPPMLIRIIMKTHNVIVLHICRHGY